MKTSLIGLPFVWTLTGLAVVSVVLVVRFRGVVRRLFAGATALLLAVLSAAAWVNHHYAYLPDVGAVLGRRAVDQVSASQLARLASVAPVAPPLTHGLVERVRIPGTTSGFAARQAQIYLPPAYFRSPRPQLPVVELLHGTPGTPEDWTRAGRADVTADRWAAVHGGMAPIIVMPDPNGSFTADTECVDGRGGRAETYLTADVPNWIIANRGASAARESWVIAGSSEGGYCALDLALRHRDRYATFVDFSGLDRPTYPGGPPRLFAGSIDQIQQHTPSWYFDHLPPGPSLAGWFEVGSADSPNYRAALRMSTAAASAGFETHVVVVPHASHTWHMWVKAFGDAFPWMATRVGLGTPATVAATTPAAPR